jgi:hypothetical protein
MKLTDEKTRRQLVRFLTTPSAKLLPLRFALTSRLSGGQHDSHPQPVEQARLTHKKGRAISDPALLFENFKTLSSVNRSTHSA